MRRARRDDGSQNCGGMLCVPYSHIAHELCIPDSCDGESYDHDLHMRQLEDLLIQCIYSNLISGKLDQQHKCLRLEPHVALVHDHSAAAGSRCSDGGGGGSKGAKTDSAATGGGIYGSLFSRDINTSSESSMQTEVSRMISEFEIFLSRSSSLLTTLEACSKASQKGKKEDDARWREVERVLDESPLKVRDPHGGSEGREGGVGGGGSATASSGGAITMGDPMELVDTLTMTGRRQVKRSKGVHMRGGEGRF